MSSYKCRDYCNKADFAHVCYSSYSYSGSSDNNCKLSAQIMGNSDTYTPISGSEMFYGRIATADEYWARKPVWTDRKSYCLPKQPWTDLASK